MTTDYLNDQIILEDMRTIYQSRKDWDELKNARIYFSGATGSIASYCILFLIFLNEYEDFHISIYAGVRNPDKAARMFGRYVGKDYFHLIVSDISLPFDEDIQLDYMVHAASLASPQYYGCAPVETMLPNVVGTNELLRWCRFHPVKGFLFFSSGAVYGVINGQQSIAEEDVGTMDFLAEGNVYSESKRCGEALCRAYYKEYGIPVKVARINHTYSPTMDIVHDKRVFSEFVSNIIKGENIVLKSDGQARRAFCYITDTVTAVFQILFQGKEGENYNVGNTDEYVRISELAELLVNLFPEKNLIVSYGTRNDSGYKPIPESQAVKFSVGKLNKLGWYPKITLKEGAYRTICYFDKIFNDIDHKLQN